jgi:hypothetical protein
MKRSHESDGPLETFRHDDDGYRAWLALHPQGYVINVPVRYQRGNEVRLHHATCRGIAPSPARTFAILRIPSRSVEPTPRS